MLQEWQLNMNWDDDAISLLEQEFDKGTFLSKCNALPNLTLVNRLLYLYINSRKNQHLTFSQNSALSGIDTAILEGRYNGKNLDNIDVLEQIYLSQNK